MLYERYFVKHVGSLGQVPEGAGAAMDPVGALLTSAPRGSAAAASIPPLRVAVSDNKKGSKGTTVAIQRQAFAEAGFRVYEGMPDAAPSDYDILWEHQVETDAYQVLRQLCLDDSVWRWSCELLVVMDIRYFHGDCACAARLLLHKETGRYRCEALNEKCGGVSRSEF
jgi:hypothetical protein